MTVKVKCIIGLILLLTSYVLGYFTHYWIKSDLKSEEVKVETVYIPSSPIKGSLINLDPIRIEMPDPHQIYPKFYYRVDTVTIDSVVYTTQVVDTASIISDYAKKCHYELSVFDIDTVGKCNITAETQFNRLQLLSYEFKPVKKITRVTTKSTWRYQPYVGIGIGNKDNYSFGVGLYIDNIGIGYQCIGSFAEDHKSHMINVSYKFNIK